MHILDHEMAHSYCAELWQMKQIPTMKNECEGRLFSGSDGWGASSSLFSGSDGWGGSSSLFSGSDGWGGSSSLFSGSDGLGGSSSFHELRLGRSIRAQISDFIVSNICGYFISFCIVGTTRKL